MQASDSEIVRRGTFYIVVDASLVHPGLLQGRRQVKICGVDRHGERGARAYNGGLEAERPSPTPPPCKTRRILSISGATSSKNGVDMSTSVHPVATTLVSCCTVHSI